MSELGELCISFQLLLILIMLIGLRHDMEEIKGLIEKLKDDEKK